MRTENNEASEHTATMSMLEVANAEVQARYEQEQSTALQRMICTRDKFFRRYSELETEIEECAAMTPEEWATRKRTTLDD